METLKVTNNEIRLVNPDPKIPVSIISLIIATHPPKKDEGGKKEVAGAKNTSFINCPLKDDVLNCV